MHTPEAPLISDLLLVLGRGPAGAERAAATAAAAVQWLAACTLRHRRHWLDAGAL